MKILRYPVASHSRRKPSSTKFAPQDPPPPPKKKALLIGIGSVPGYAPLKGTHADVAAMRKLLMSRYGYKEADIVTLLDAGEGVQPTRVNILRAIDDLVHGARKGDRFFFHYCGHTIQVENRSNSEEDGMDECLVPADGDANKIMDNELRRHLVNALPVGSSLVAVFDSCHSASLLDLTHFRCNRVYVPWISKGRRRSDERWNAVVRKHALPLLPLSKPATPATSPPASRRHTLTHAELATPVFARSPLAPQLVEPNGATARGDTRPPPVRRSTRHGATREIRELMQLLGKTPGSESDAPPPVPSLPPNIVPPVVDGLVPTRPNSPEATPVSPSAPLVTTRRIYEASRTSSRRVCAWRTEVGALELDVSTSTDFGADRDGGGGEEEEEQPRGLTRAGTDFDARVRKGRKNAYVPRGPSIASEAEVESWRRRRKRASMPLVPLRPESLAALGRGLGLRTRREPQVEGGADGVQRRTAVTRARAVSVAVREREPAAEKGKQAEKENAPSPGGEPSVRPTLKVATNEVAPLAPPQSRLPRPVSWFDEEAESRECESPAPIWECTGWACRDPAHAHDDVEEQAEVISLASCKDHQLSWEDASGGSMTRELVRILDQDPHPSLRSLVTRVSHALHRMTLERHLDTRRYKRQLKEYEAWQRKHQARAAVSADPKADRDAELDSSGATVAITDARTTPSASGSPSRTSTLSPTTPGGDATRSVSRSSGAALTATEADADLDVDVVAATKMAFLSPKTLKKVVATTKDAVSPPPPRVPMSKAKSEGFVGEPPYDMDSFQDPQLASHRPLDMERPWSM